MPCGTATRGCRSRWSNTGEVLRLEVVNAVEDAVTAPITADGMTRVPGTGLDGMRARLDAVGGRLDVRQRREQAGRHTLPRRPPGSPCGPLPPAGGGGST